MKKINKLLSLLLVLALLVPLLNVSSVEANPLAEYQFPVLTGPDYFNIENSGLAAGGGIKDTIDFIEGFNENGVKVNESATFSVVSTGNYTAGQLSWKTTRIIVALDYYNPISGKVERLGYQFRPDELIKANNATTTITINKEQAVAGILNGMNVNTGSLYIEQSAKDALAKAIAEGFENGCG